MWSYLDSLGTCHKHLSEDEVLSLLRAQNIHQDSLMWRRGYHHWRPLKETELAAYLPTQSTTELPNEQHAQALEPRAHKASVKLTDVLGATKTLPALALFLACLQLGSSALSIWLESRFYTQAQSVEQWRDLQFESLQRLQDGEPNNRELILKLLLAFQLLVSVLFAFHWLRWQYRSAQNARLLQLPFVHHPLLSLIWWFLPLVQLFMPWVVLSSLLSSCSRSSHGRWLLKVAALCWLSAHMLVSANLVLNAALLDTGFLMNRDQAFSRQFPGISQFVLEQLGLQSITLLGVTSLLVTLLNIACLWAALKLAQHIAEAQVRIATQSLAQKGLAQKREVEKKL